MSHAAGTRRARPLNGDHMASAYAETEHAEHAEHEPFFLNFPVSGVEETETGEIVIRGIASDEGLDLENEMVKATGWLDGLEYLCQQGKVNWDHDAANPIGDIDKARIVDADYVEKRYGFRPVGKAVEVELRLWKPNDEMNPIQKEALQRARGIALAGGRMGLSMEGVRLHSVAGEVKGQPVMQTQKAWPYGIALTAYPVNPRGVARTVRVAKSLSELIAGTGEEGTIVDLFLCKGGVEQLPGGITMNGSDIAKGLREIVEMTKGALLETGYGTDSLQLTGGAALRRSGLNGGKQTRSKGRRIQGGAIVKSKKRKQKKGPYERTVAAGAKLGSGARFRAVAEEARRGGARDPEAVAAAVGRRKYGKKRFQQMAAAGRKK